MGQPTAVPVVAARALTVALTGAALALAGCAVGRGNGATAHDPALAGRVDALVAPLVAANAFSGAIVLERSGKMVYARGFGLANRTAGVAFTPETPSDGGSIAKTFTAAALWALVHEGRLALDTPVEQLVPEFPHRRTTVRQLLAHSNGLPPYYEFFDPHFAVGAVRTTPEMLRVVAGASPDPRFEPGMRFEYSNLGYDAAGLVIERVSGQGYEAFVRERFLAPLGMSASFARPARLADWRGVRTQGYRFRDGAWRDFDAFDGEAFLGASNLYFSTRDLARWGSAQIERRVLPAPALAAGQRPSTIAGQPSPISALSWYCDPHASRCHYTGSVNAFHAFVHWDRARAETIAFVSNSTLPPWQTIALQHGLVDALAGRAPKSAAPPAFDRFDRRSRASISGRYVAEGVGSVRVSTDGDTLRLRVDAGLEFELFQVSRDAFYVPGRDWWLAFSGGQAARRMHLRSMYVDAVAQREAL